MTWHVQGDMSLDADLQVHGWCWCPARPEDRLGLELLVNGRVVARGIADQHRPDLGRLGIGDGRHGFRLALSGADFDAGEPCIVSARAPPGGMVFGQLRQEPPAAAPPGRRELALRQAVEDISDRLSRLAGQAPPPSRHALLRQAAGALAAVLRARARGAARPGIAAARALLLAEAAGLDLRGPARPRVSLLIAPQPRAEAALRALRQVMALQRGVPAEVLLGVPPGVAGADGRLALLPSVVPGLRLFASGDSAPPALFAAASPAARGDWLALCHRGCGALPGERLRRAVDGLDRAGAAQGSVGALMLTRRSAP